MSNLKSSWSSYSAISKALSKLPLPEQHHWFYGIAHEVSCTVQPAKSDSEVMICLQSYQGLIID